MKLIALFLGALCLMGQQIRIIKPVLPTQKLMAFIGAKDAKTAKAFYKGKLGLKLLSEEPMALMFDANGTKLRVQIGPNMAPPPFTTLGWEVENIEAALNDLVGRGVVFERFQGLKQDALGVWEPGGGIKIAWFKDPDGNILSLSQFPKTR